MNNKELTCIKNVISFLKENNYVLNNIKTDNYILELENIYNKYKEIRIKNNDRMKKQHRKDDKKNYKKHLLYNNLYNAKKTKNKDKIEYYTRLLKELKEN